MIVYTNRNNPLTLKLLISAKVSNLVLSVEHVEVSDVKFPIKQLPQLKTDVPASSPIISSNSAAKYLFGESDSEVIDELLSWESLVLVPLIVKQFTTKAGDEIKNVLKENLSGLEALLGSNVYLTGSNLSVADVVLFSTIYPITLIDNSDLIGKSLRKWLEYMKELPSVKETLAEYSVDRDAYLTIGQYASIGTVTKQLESATIVQLESMTVAQSEPKTVPQSEPKTTTQSEPRTVPQSEPKKISKSESVTSSQSPQTPTHSVNVDENEKITAKKAWDDTLHSVKLEKKPQEIAPEPGKRNILITSALPYVNNVPHLGNLIGCVLSADVYARYCRMCNYNTIYISGTDEYGTATETKALAENLTPQQICDKYFDIHNDVYRWFHIGFDFFGRTSHHEHAEVCQEYFLKINNNGFIHTESVEQLYCANCDRFLADRFVEGVCPHLGCGYEDARGDQCDKCGKLVNAIDLKQPRCKVCSLTPQVRESVQFFLDLPKIESLLKHWMDRSCDGWSSNAKLIAQSWMKEGLKSRCITRDLKWGIPVPLDGFRSKVFYVWFDAVLGYLSMTKRFLPKHWSQWWKPDKSTNVELVQFMAKDNVPFHAVILPSMCLAINEGHVKVKQIAATEYLNYESGKFSKSRGVGVFGTDARDTGIPADIWRFYLLFMRPETQDSSFSWADLVMKNNSELLNNLGNFINRASVFVEKQFNSTIPPMELNADDLALLAMCNREVKSYVNSLEKCRLREGIRFILMISKHGNQYMQANTPWVLVKGSDAEKKRAGTIIGLSCNIAAFLTILLQPYMPESSRRLQSQLLIKDDDLVLNSDSPTIRQILKPGHKIGKPEPLFAKIEMDRAEELRKKYAGAQDDTIKPTEKSTSNNVDDLTTAVANQADKVRQLKSSGVEKSVWQPEVSFLLSLKKQLETAQQAVKSLFNGKPDTSEPKIPGNLGEIEAKMTAQSEKVRVLKQSGADKSVWQPEVETLLKLKADFVAAGGVLAQPVKTKKSKK